MGGLPGAFSPAPPYTQRSTAFFQQTDFQPVLTHKRITSPSEKRSRDRPTDRQADDDKAEQNNPPPPPLFPKTDTDQKHRAFFGGGAHADSHLGGLDGFLYTGLFGGGVGAHFCPFLALSLLSLTISTCSYKKKRCSLAAAAYAAARRQVEYM